MQVGRNILRELLDMMSAWKEEGFMEKRTCIKGGRVNSVVYFRSKCGQGGEGVNKSKNSRTSYLEAPLHCYDYIFRRVREKVPPWGCTTNPLRGVG